MKRENQEIIIDWITSSIGEDTFETAKSILLNNLGKNIQFIDNNKLANENIKNNEYIWQCENIIETISNALKPKCKLTDKYCVCATDFNSIFYTYRLEQGEECPGYKKNDEYFNNNTEEAIKRKI
jgi:hypothetical protein